MTEPKLSRTQVLEATAASVMAAAILTTASGMMWLVVQLPNRLQALEARMQQIIRNQDQFSSRFDDLQKQVIDLDKRTIKLELNR